MIAKKYGLRGSVALGVILIAASTTSSLGQTTTTTWTGSQDNSWSNQSNWNNGVPNISDVAVIDTSPSAIVSSREEALSLTVNNDGNLAVFGNLRVEGNMYVGEEGDSGDLATVTINNNLGRAFLTAGTLSIGSGSGKSEVIVGQRGVLDAVFIDINSGGQLILEGGDPGPVVLATSIRMSDGDIVFSQTGNIDDFPVIFGDGGRLLVESGSTRLRLDSSGFAGTTDISGGTLQVDTTLGGTINVTGGTLLGTGTATGTVTVASGGTLAPGNSVGTFRAQDVTLEDGSIFAVEIDSRGRTDLLQSGGTVTLEGGSVSVTADSYDEDASFTIITADTAVDGSFSEVTTTTYVGYVLSYDSTSVTLNQTITQSFSDVASSANHMAIATALDGFETSHGIVQGLLGSTSEADALDAFDQLSGQVHASVKGALAENGQRVVDAINDRLYRDKIGVKRAGADGSTGADHATGSADRRTGWWLTGYGNWSKTDATANTASMTNDAGGIVAGVDRRIGDHALVGVMGGYGHTSVSVGDLGSDSDVDGYTLGAYGRVEAGATAFNAGALYTWYDIGTSRTIANPFHEQLGADYDADAWQIFAEASHEFALQHAAITPFAGISHIGLQTDGFSESGGASALTASSDTTNTTFTTLGIRTAAAVSERVTVHGMAGWRHAFGDVDPVSVFTLDGSAPFAITGAPIAEDALVTEFGLDIAAAEAASVGLSYRGQFADDADAHGVFGRLFVRF